MGEKMRNFRNRTWNTVAIAPRTIRTWVNTVCDTTKTALYWVLDPVEWLWKTAVSIKNAVTNACTWPRYHQLRRIPTSLAASPLMLVEWAAETLRYSWCNLLRNIKDTIANPFINLWRSIKRIWSKQPLKEFRFEKIRRNKDVSPKNYLANLFKELEEPAPIVRPSFGQCWAPAYACA